MDLLGPEPEDREIADLIEGKVKVTEVLVISFSFFFFFFLIIGFSE
jgi:hypothetical protein